MGFGMAAWGLAWALAWPAAPSEAQVRPDSLVLDTLRSDTLELDLDTIPRPAEGDSVSADTIFYNLPRLQGEDPPGWGRGIWAWDHDDIMASGAVSVAELVAEVPGIVTLLGGDYGTPLGLSAFGTGGGGFRVFRDGFEVTPLSGGVTDLQRIGLGGVHHVRLERSAGEMLIHLRSLEFEDGRPYSLVEAATGDMDTNIFRGAFADPVALGGSVALAIERADTQGRSGNEAGNRQGTWVRYQLHRGDDTGLALDFRRMGIETSVPDYVSPATRTDWTIRGRHRLTRDLVFELYTGNSTHAVEDVRTTYETEGGSVRQSGLRLSFQRDGIWMRGALRRFSGDLPAHRMDAAAGLSRVAVGGISGRVQRASWGGTSTSATALRAWTEPFFGLSLFGSWESGTYGARSGPPLDVVPPPDTTGTEAPPADTVDVGELMPLFGLTERTARRLGAQLQWKSARISGALLKLESDSLLPLGLEMDRGLPLLPGAERSGWEVWGRVPVPIMEGLHLKGSLQRWETAGIYLPEEIYRGGFEYHKVLKATGTAELWWALGVRGRKPMSIHSLGEEVLDDETGETSLRYTTVPFFQSWYARIQIRIVSMRIFIGWENFTRRPELQDFPDRVLPVTRSYYGIRWTLWN
jgi:hypothetical protein